MIRERAENTFPGMPGTTQRLRRGICLLSGGEEADVSEKIAQFRLSPFPPLSTYKNYFNIVQIDAASRRCGIPDSQDPSYGNFWGAYYGCNGERSICVDDSAVISRINQAYPQLSTTKRRAVLLVANNSTRRGGGGGAVATSYNGPDLGDVASHELGHQFAQLEDEYTYDRPCDLGAAGPNVTSATTCGGAPWAHWIAPGSTCPTTATTDGIPNLYEGARYCPTGLYRPTYDSMMRTVGRPWYQVNSENWITAIYRSTQFPDPPAEPNITKQKGEQVEFVARVPDKTLSTIRYTWTIDGTEKSTGSGESYSKFQVDTNQLALGQHTVKVVVEDLTSAVKTQDRNRSRARPSGTCRSIAIRSLHLCPGIIIMRNIVTLKDMSGCASLYT